MANAKPSANSPYRTYQRWAEYKENKLAGKQADRFFDELCVLFATLPEVEEVDKFYEVWHKTHLYNKHSGLYCQVLSDVNMYVGIGVR